MRKSMKTIVCAALGFALILGLAGCGAAPAGTAAPEEKSPEVTVSASSTVRLTPDKATVSLGVTTQEASAEEAQSRNSEIVDQVIAVLAARGVEKKSIRTAYYNLYPQYDWSDSGERRLIGYSVTTSLSVQDQDIDALGELLSACVSAGVTSIDSVSFLCSGYDEAYSEALAQAVEASRGKAEILAKAAGRKLGEAVVIDEGWQNTSARYGQTTNVSYDMAEEAVKAPSFQPGETEISASVTVTWRME